MTDHIISDADISRAWTVFLAKATEWHPAHGSPYDFARAVEAAVLAKIDRSGWPKAGLPIAEREARARERLAFHNGAVWGEEKNSIYLGGGQYARPKPKNVDELYPLSTKRVSRTVTLSDGLSVTGHKDGVFTFGTGHQAIDIPAGTNQVACLLSRAKTPADARLLADLAERPTEEVPDDR